MVNICHVSSGRIVLLVIFKKTKTTSTDTRLYTKHCAQLYRMYTDYTDPIGLIKIGFLILIAVVSFPTENPLIISSVILIAALVLGFSYGIQLDDQNGTFRQFKSFLGFKYGPWQSLRDFDSIYILKRTIRSGERGF